MTNSVLIIINYSHINIETSIWGKNSSNDQGINLLFQLLVINIRAQYKLLHFREIKYVEQNIFVRNPWLLIPTCGNQNQSKVRWKLESFVTWKWQSRREVWDDVRRGGDNYNLL